MKKTAALILALILAAALLAGCGDSGKTTASTATTSSGNNQATDGATGYTFTYKGIKLGINMNASVVDSLGEPKSKQSTPSCAFEGDDTQYFYGSFYLTTGSDGGEEVVTCFWFADDTVQTDEGVAIGDSKDKVETVYGADGYNGTNAYIYEKDYCRLTFIISNDMVSDITYIYRKK